jgi:hypothetical protein
MALVDPIDLSGEDSVAVVGESFYQERLSGAAGPKRPGGVELRTRFALVREPENPHDQNAIAVELEDGGTVGYLSRDDAVAYGPLLAQCAARGRPAVTEGVILGGDAGRDTAFGVWLHLRGPAESLR